MITVTSEQVLTPLAETVSQLILICDNSDRTGIPLPDFSDIGLTVAMHVQHLVSVGKNIQETLEPNNVFYKRLDDACTLLGDSCHRLISASKGLKSNVNQSSYKKDLMESVKGLLQGTRNILDANDDLEVSKIVKGADTAIEFLKKFQDLKTVKDLTSIVQPACQSFVNIISLLKARVSELSDANSRDKLNDLMKTLSDSTPLLIGAAKLCVMQTWSDEAKSACKKWSLSLIDVCLDMKTLVINHGWESKQKPDDLVGFDWDGTKRSLWNIYEAKVNNQDEEDAFKTLETCRQNVKSLPASKEVVDVNVSNLTEIERALKSNDNKVLYNAVERSILDLQNFEIKSTGEYATAIYSSIKRLQCTTNVPESLFTVIETLQLNETESATVLMSQLAAEKEKAVVMSKHLAANNISTSIELSRKAEELEHSFENVREAINATVTEINIAKKASQPLAANQVTPAKEYLKQVTDHWTVKLEDFKQSVDASIPSYDYVRMICKEIDTCIKTGELEKVPGLKKLAISHVTAELANIHDPPKRERIELQIRKLEAADSPNTALSLLQELDLAPEVKTEFSIPKYEEKEPEKEPEVVEEEVPVLLTVEEAIENPIKAAAVELKVEAAKWKEDENPLVAKVNKLGASLERLHQYYKMQNGSSKAELIDTTQAIIELSQLIIDDGVVLAEHCSDVRLQNHMATCLERIPTIGQQLKIVCAVKASNPSDSDTEKQIITCAKNILAAVKALLQAGESASLRWVDQPIPHDRIALIKNSRRLTATRSAPGENWKIRFVRRIANKKA